MNCNQIHINRLLIMAIVVPTHFEKMIIDNSMTCVSVGFQQMINGVSVRKMKNQSKATSVYGAFDSEPGKWGLGFVEVCWYIFNDKKAGNSIRSVPMFIYLRKLIQMSTFQILEFHDFQVWWIV